MGAHLSSDDRDALKKAAEIIRKQAVRNSSGFSRRIPASLKVVATDSSVAVIADGTIAPNAAPFEGPEYHPLFGNTHYWYQQPWRPFMVTAAEMKIDSAMDAYTESVFDYARKHGFK